MGRIAEALKKAEKQRREQSGEEFAPPNVPLFDPIAPHGPQSLESFLDSAPKQVEAPSASDESIDETIVPFYDRASIISEQYRSLRTRLLTQNPQNDHRVLAITSSIPQEGKSVTTLNLGMILAEIRHLKVLCVDGDFRRSSLAGLLHTRSKPGLGEILRGEAPIEEAIQTTPIPNLYVVTAGQTRGNAAAELLASQRTAAVFRRLQSEFHYTLVDTPPATTVTDVNIIGQMCSGVVLVVRLNVTPEPIARRAVRLLRVNNIPIIGCLLIGQDHRGPGYGYAYRYYRYYTTEAENV